MRVNREIRAKELRVIGSTGEQLGIYPLDKALQLAEDQDLDLIEIVPTATPPVAKIMKYGKFRYDQTKREKESKKTKQQKVKEIKFNLNIDDGDLNVKLNHAKEFLDDGDKVKVTVMYRGREVMHPEVGARLVEKITKALEDVSIVETPPKQLGRFLNIIFSPSGKKKK